MNNEKNTIGEEQIRKKEVEEWMRYVKTVGYPLPRK